MEDLSKVRQGFSDAIFASVVGGFFGIGAMVTAALPAAIVSAILSENELNIASAITATAGVMFGAVFGAKKGRKAYSETLETVSGYKKSTAPKSYSKGIKLGATLTAASIVFGGYKLTDHFNPHAITQAKNQIVDVIKVPYEKISLAKREIK